MHYRLHAFRSVIRSTVLHPSSGLEPSVSKLRASLQALVRSFCEQWDSFSNNELDDSLSFRITNPKFSTRLQCTVKANDADHIEQI